MGTKKTEFNPTLPEYISLDNLEIGKNNQNVVLRVLRIWEARNFKLNGSLMSLDLLLLDEKDTLIQGSIHHRRINKFRDVLKEGQVYLISNFEVVSAYSHYKVSDHLLSIRFTDTTKLDEVDEDDCSINHEKFRVYSYAEFKHFAGTNLHLLDVVGQVLEVQGSKLEDSNSNQKIVLVLLLQDNSTIRVTLWDNQASEFRQKIQQNDKECSVLVVTCLNPKMFAGKLHLNSSGATKVYINYNLEIVKAFIRRMGIENSIGSTKIVEQDNTKLNMEIWTIDQILQYIASGVKQEIEVICTGKIVDICNRNGWNYLSCASCSKKLGRSATALICNQCNKTTTIGVARFRIELTVEAGDQTTTFILFDKDAKKLLHITAEDLIASNENEGEKNNINQIIPASLLELIGKKMNFQVKISEYSFQSSVPSFTVTRIINQPLVPDSKDNNKLTKASMGMDETEVPSEQNIKTEDGKKIMDETEVLSEQNIKTEDGKKKPSDGEKNPKKRRLM